MGRIGDDEILRSLRARGSAAAQIATAPSCRKNFLMIEIIAAAVASGSNNNVVDDDNS